MELTISSAFILQGTGAATAKAAQTDANAPVLSKADVQRLREQARQAVRAAIAGTPGAAGTQDAVQNPTPAPQPTHDIIIRGPNGTETVVGMPSNFDTSHIIPPQAVEISIAFFVMVAAIIIGLPLARAFSRRMDRAAVRPNVAPEISTQLAQLNQSLDAIALEVERISENQRYTTKLLSEQRGQGQQTLPAEAGH
jgi:hypothetical protein